MRGHDGIVRDGENCDKRMTGLDCFTEKSNAHSEIHLKKNGE